MISNVFQEGKEGIRRIFFLPGGMSAAVQNMALERNSDFFQRPGDALGRMRVAVAVDDGDRTLNPPETIQKPPGPPPFRGFVPDAGKHFSVRCACGDACFR